MAGFFKRLSRLARAEINSLGSKFSSNAEVNAADDELQEAINSAAGEPSENVWPREIREAYAALELPLGSDEKAVKKSYRLLLNRYHPDKHQGTPEKLDTANAITVKVREAYEKLVSFLQDRETTST
jgi:DnaJ-domain-containing protein 1